MKALANSSQKPVHIERFGWKMLARQKLVLLLHQYLTVAAGKQHLLAFPSLN